MTANMNSSYTANSPASNRIVVIAAGQVRPVQAAHKVLRVLRALRELPVPPDQPDPLDPRDQQDQAAQQFI